MNFGTDFLQKAALKSKTHNEIGGPGSISRENKRCVKEIAYGENRRRGVCALLSEVL